MTRADWLLLFVTANPVRPLEPVRLQKGLFLLAMSGALPEGERYAFEPYSYGPMSRDLYRDARLLSRDGLLTERCVPGHTWTTSAATAEGRRRAMRLRDQAAADRPEALAALRRIRDLVDTLGFAELLSHVYERHPAYAARSVFRRP